MAQLNRLRDSEAGDYRVHDYIACYAGDLNK